MSTLQDRIRASRTARTAPRGTRRTHQLRKELEAAIDAAVAALDALDGDPDLEDGGDREAACEDEGAMTGDDEPWLVAPQGTGRTGSAWEWGDLEVNETLAR